MCSDALFMLGAQNNSKASEKHVHCVTDVVICVVYYYSKEQSLCKCNDIKEHKNLNVLLLFASTRWCCGSLWKLNQMEVALRRLLLLSNATHMAFL